MARELWLIRHAETEWSKAHKHTGRTDIPLTDTGREIARGLRGTLGGQSFAAVFVSPLGRARETADLAGLGEGAHVRDDLMEWDYGAYEGITTADIRKERPDWFLWRDGVPGGEMPDEVAARCDRVVAEVRAVEGKVALVAHGHILRALAACWIDAPVDLGGRLHLGTGTVSVLAYEREVAVISRWNT
jgi:broad specificity phosphatase PhoE